MPNGAAIGDRSAGRAGVGRVPPPAGKAAGKVSRGGRVARVIFNALYALMIAAGFPGDLAAGYMAGLWWLGLVRVAELLRGLSPPM